MWFGVSLSHNQGSFVKNFNSTLQIMCRAGCRFGASAARFIRFPPREKKVCASSGCFSTCKQRVFLTLGKSYTTAESSRPTGDTEVSAPATNLVTEHTTVTRDMISGLVISRRKSKRCFGMSSEGAVYLLVTHISHWLDLCRSSRTPCARKWSCKAIMSSWYDVPFVLVQRSDKSSVG